jgi:hypothetical protein
LQAFSFCWVLAGEQLTLHSGDDIRLTQLEHLQDRKGPTLARMHQLRPNLTKTVKL